MRFAPNCNASPDLAGPVGSSYEDYSVTKDTDKKLIESVKHTISMSENKKARKTISFCNDFNLYIVIDI